MGVVRKLFTPGNVIRLFDQPYLRVKYHIIIAETSSTISTVLINSDPRRAGSLTPQLKPTQFDISQQDCPCLEYDSHIDGSKIYVHQKRIINEILNKEPGRKEKPITEKKLAEIVAKIKSLDIYSEIDLQYYGLI